MSPATLFFTLLLAIVWFFPPALAENKFAGKEPAAAADLILSNGQIFTMDSARSWSDAVAVADGRIVYVGSDSGSKPFIGSKTKVVDLKGKLVLPGFVDSHVHPLHGGQLLMRCDLSRADTAAAAMDIIRVYLKEHRLAPGEWFQASGWGLPLWPGGNPRKEDLDRIVRDNPAYIESSDHHSAWVNSLALRQAGIDRQTRDPRNGRIERESQTREPSGALREAAMQMVASHIPSDSLEERVSFIGRALREANKFGITSMQDANVTEPILQAYQRLQDDGMLSVRIVACLFVDPAKGTEQVSDLVKLRAKYSKGLLQASSAKFFVDGVIETQTAALLKPYLTKAGPLTGTLNFQTTLLNSLVSKLDKEGFQIHMHTIGDRAVRAGLDALALVQSKNGNHDLRHQLAHLELVDPKDIPRFVRLRAVANFEPYWFYPDAYVVDLTEPKLGPARSARLYPIHSLIKSGAVVAAGSDWPVTTLNPLDAIEVAVRRVKPESSLKTKPWLANQCIDLSEAIAAYTINGAFANHEEQSTGSIEVGKYADLIVLDKNLFEIAPSEIHTAKVVWTLLSGKEVFRDSSW